MTIKSRIRLFSKHGPLGRLEDFIRDMPDDIGKAANPEALFEQLVIDHVRELAPTEREELFTSLPEWLVERPGHPSRPFLVPLLGCVFDRPELVDQAIQTAKSRRAWWPFLQLELMHLSRRFPSASLTEFVRTLAEDLDRASTDEERTIAARAGITLCFLSDPDGDRACLNRVLAAARKHPGRHISEALVLTEMLFGRTERLRGVDSLFTAAERERAREIFGEYESVTRPRGGGDHGHADDPGDR